jgi:sugar/nucleoside kinase (ribokinase family)
LRVLCLGDLVLDVLTSPSEPLVVGSDVAGTIRFRAGGSAANTARAVARLGGRATFVGAIGDDAIGRRLAGSLRADGVRCHLVRAAGPAAPTARLVALLGPRGERSFVTERGAADRLAERDLKHAWFHGLAALHLPAYALLGERLRGAAIAGARLAHERGAIVSVDLASSAPLARMGRQMARGGLSDLGPDLLFGTAAEASVLADHDGALLDLAPLVVVRAGHAGSRILIRTGRGDRRLEIAIHPLRTTDSTGAGDAFDAGFLLSWLRDRGSGDPELRRAALAGHEAAETFLREPRPELAL